MYTSNIHFWMQWTAKLHSQLLPNSQFPEWKSVFTPRKAAFLLISPHIKARQVVSPIPSTQWQMYKHYKTRCEYIINTYSVTETRSCDSCEPKPIWNAVCLLCQRYRPQSRIALNLILSHTHTCVPL